MSPKGQGALRVSLVRADSQPDWSCWSLPLVGPLTGPWLGAPPHPVLHKETKGYRCTTAQGPSHSTWTCPGHRDTSVPSQEDPVPGRHWARGCRAVFGEADCEKVQECPARNQHRRTQGEIRPHQGTQQRRLLSWVCSGQGNGSQATESRVCCPTTCLSGAY